MRRHFQKSQADRQTDNFFLKKTLKKAIYSSKFLFYISDIKKRFKKPLKQFCDQPTDQPTNGPTEKWLIESRSTRLKIHMIYIFFKSDMLKNKFRHIQKKNIYIKRKIKFF